MLLLRKTFNSDEVLPMSCLVPAAMMRIARKDNIHLIMNAYSQAFDVLESRSEIHEGNGKGHSVDGKTASRIRLRCFYDVSARYFCNAPLQISRGSLNGSQEQRREVRKSAMECKFYHLSTCSFIEHDTYHFEYKYVLN